VENVFQHTWQYLTAKKYNNIALTFAEMAAFADVWRYGIVLTCMLPLHP
jgi:hypothetical protein